MSKILACQKTCSRYQWQVKLSSIITEYALQGVAMFPKWYDIRVEAMEHVLRLKFETDLHCRNVLLSTEDSYPFEQSTCAFWGCGSDGLGKNN